MGATLSPCCGGPGCSRLTVHTECWTPTGLLPVLQVLDAAKTLEPPVHHDGQAGAERLALLHAGKTGLAFSRGTGLRWGQLGSQAAMATPPGVREGNRGCLRFPLLPVPQPNAIPWGPRSPLPPTHHPRCITGAVRTSPGPVGREHHGATRFDDIQDEVPEEAPCLGVHPCGGLILRDRQHPQTRQHPGRPATPFLSRAWIRTPSHPNGAHGGAGNRQLPPRVISPPLPGTSPGVVGGRRTPEAGCWSQSRTRKMKAGYPISAMAVDSFLLFPPL